MADNEAKKCWTRSRKDGSQYVTCNDAEDAQNRCPSSPPRDDPSWKPYVGDSSVFHCGYEGYLANHNPTPESPMAECFYDEEGRLVDDQHPYSGCQGTANDYSADDPRHIFIDRGGIAMQGLKAWRESNRHKKKTGK